MEVDDAPEGSAGAPSSTPIPGASHHHRPQPAPSSASSTNHPCNALRHHWRNNHRRPTAKPPSAPTHSRYPSAPPIRPGDSWSFSGPRAFTAIVAWRYSHAPPQTGVQISMDMANETLGKFLECLILRRQEAEGLTALTDDDALIKVAKSINAGHYFESVLKEWREDVFFLEMRLKHGDQVGLQSVRVVLLDVQWKDLGLNKKQWQEKAEDGWTVSKYFITSLDYLQGKMSVVEEALNEVDFVGVWRSLATGPDRLLFNGVLMSTVKFHDGGVERLGGDLAVLFGVFGAWCLRPEGFFPKVTGSLKLLKMEEKQLKGVTVLQIDVCAVCALIYTHHRCVASLPATTRAFIGAIEEPPLRRPSTPLAQQSPVPHSQARFSPDALPLRICPSSLPRRFMVPSQASAPSLPSSPSVTPTRRPRLVNPSPLFWFHS
ncbi:hypothetical protein U1Q18_019617 [Sarracenia purpurea var. burkii]